ncbi:MAG: protein meaA [Spirochaetia bacterium]|nr:protein meaA [Spirochaetia bacterium]
MNLNSENDRPWIFRTYAGHTGVKSSNSLFLENLKKGQTGLSIAFDLPTQCGYSSDHPAAELEIGRVGVPVNTLDDMILLFENIPIEKMNTAMTINATSMWILSLYIALAQERNIDISLLRGTTQNDIIKEYLSRGTYIFPPEPSMRIIAEMYEYCVKNIPGWNPSNICSYHLAESGAVPSEEVALSLANAMCLLDLLKERNHLSNEDFNKCAGRISFFVNAGIRFIEEMCKIRSFAELWDEILLQKYNIQNPDHRIFRYGVQVNSLNLTEAQPENNAWRILLETLGVTLSKNSRCRALQLPGWNEALSLPRPWDQQWSLRLQQILAYETDLLENEDIFTGNPVIENKTMFLKQEIKAKIDEILEHGGVINGVKSGFLKSILIKSLSRRMERIDSGEQAVVGINCFREGIPSPLTSGPDGGILKLDPGAAGEALKILKKTRLNRNEKKVQEALEKLKHDAKYGKNMMEASIQCAHVRVSTGEWADALRNIFGEFRPATGIESQRISMNAKNHKTIEERIFKFIEKTGKRPKILIGKPGLDGHSNGAEMIAVGARQAGFDVIYQGIRLTVDEIIQTAQEEHVDVIGISILSGSHMEFADRISKKLKSESMNLPVIFGGIIPKSDIKKLKGIGIAGVFTPSDFQIMKIMEQILEIIEQHAEHS